MFSKYRTDSFIVHSESKEKKHYPGFPMSQTEAIDKEKQYEIDMENSRRLLAEAREKRMLEQKAKKLNNKNRKKSISNTDTPKVEPKEAPAPVAAVVKEKDDVKRYNSKKDVSSDEESSDSDFEWKKSPQKSNKNKKKRKWNADSSDDEELGVVEVKGN